MTDSSAPITQDLSEPSYSTSPISVKEANAPSSEENIELAAIEPTSSINLKRLILRLSTLAIPVLLFIAAAALLIGTSAEDEQDFRKKLGFVSFCGALSSLTIIGFLKKEKLSVFAEENAAEQTYCHII